MKKELLIYFLGKVIPAIINLVVIVLAVRYMGKSEYGKYSLIYTSIMLIHSFSFGWVQQSSLRFLSMYPNSYCISVNRMIVLLGISSLAGCVLTLSIDLFYFHLTFTDIVITLLFLVLFNFFMFRLVIHQINYKSSRYVILEIKYYLFFLLFLLLFLLYYKYSSQIILFWAMCISLGLVFAEEILRFVLSERRKVFSSVYWNVQFSKKMFGYGFQITFWLFISYLFNIVDRFIIKEFVGMRAVGIYSSVYDILFKISTFACMPVLLTFHPRISELWNKNEVESSLLTIKRALKIELGLIILVTLGFIAIKGFIYDTILKLNEGPLWHLTVPILLSGFLWQIAMLLYKPLEMQLKQKFMIIGCLLSLCVNIILNVLLIPVLGYQVAAYTTLIGVLTYIVFVLIITNKYCNINHFIL